MMFLGGLGIGIALGIVLSYFLYNKKFYLLDKYWCNKVKEVDDLYFSEDQMKGGTGNTGYFGIFHKETSKYSTADDPVYLCYLKSNDVKENERTRIVLNHFIFTHDCYMKDGRSNILKMKDKK